MAYVYRFKDINNNIIYVGKTAQTLDRRISQHLTKGHLPKECYRNIARIEYQKYKTESDSLVMETYYITKYNPKYNTLQKSRDLPTLELDNKEWKIYKVYKLAKEPFKPKWGLIQIAFLIYFLYTLIKFVANVIQ
jgi:excinuclease UvrABC nuclease subunit